MKKKEILLVALDMDGTLLNNEGQVSDANREAIKFAQEKGVHIICSTGRSMLTSRDYIKSLGLTSYHITVNGSEIWDEKGELVHRIIISTEQIHWLNKIAQDYKVKFWATSTEHVWRKGMPIDIDTYTWLKFGFVIEEDDLRQKVLHLLHTRSHLIEISNSSPINIEINAKGVNKARGVEKVCKQLGLSMSQVLAIGDSLNDLPMIEAAGVGVAMRNAQEIVKQKADWVTATNDEDGVAKAIHKWVLMD